MYGQDNIEKHLLIIHVTSYNKTTRRILFVDISQALVEIIYSTDRKSHQTGTLCSNIQPRGCGAVLLSLCVILTSITVNGLLVIIYPTELVNGGNCLYRLIMATLGQHPT